MRLHYHNLNQSHGAGALAGLLVLLFPILLPCLFSPLTHASPSAFSVCFTLFMGHKFNQLVSFPSSSFWVGGFSRKNINKNKCQLYMLDSSFCFQLSSVSIYNGFFLHFFLG